MKTLKHGFIGELLRHLWQSHSSSEAASWQTFATGNATWTFAAVGDVKLCNFDPSFALPCGEHCKLQRAYQFAVSVVVGAQKAGIEAAGYHSTSGLQRGILAGFLLASPLTSRFRTSRDQLERNNATFCIFAARGLSAFEEDPVASQPCSMHVQGLSLQDGVCAGTAPCCHRAGLVEMPCVLSQLSKGKESSEDFIGQGHGGIKKTWKHLEGQAFSHQGFAARYILLVY